MRSRQRYSPLLLVLLIPAASALAQLGAAGITGVVSDPTGAAIPRASVIVKNKATGQTRETATARDGVYTLMTLPPAVYEIKIEAPNFKLFLMDHVSVRVGEVITLSATLKPAGVNETVEVKASEVRGVDTTTSHVAGFITDRTVENLPLNGRNFLDLAFLHPGNSPAPNFDPAKNNTVQISSAGQVGRGGNLSVDGADNNDDAFGGTLQNFPQDAVREFQILTNRFSAEIGRSASSAINVVTQSGGNEFHGAAGLYFRHARLSALPATLDRSIVKEVGRPPFDREQYTVSLGGPLKPDRAWFFTAFEYRNQDAIVITGRRDLKAQRIFNTYSPAPLNDLLMTGRGDWQVNGQDRMMWRYALQDEDDIGSAFSQRSFNTASQRQRDFNNHHSLVYNWGHTFSPRLLNDLVFQASRFTNQLLQIVSEPELLFPSISDGNNYLLPNNAFQNRFQWRDNLSLIAGAHALKIGGEFQRVDDAVSITVFGLGSIALAEDFASLDRNRDGIINDHDIPILFTAQLETYDPKVPLHNHYLALYLQDDWKVRRNFTLNLGVRYELDTNAKNVGFFKQLNPIVRPFLSGSRKSDRNNFGPRFGFNWDPRGDGRTSMHGGYGIYYDRTILNLLDNEQRFDGRRSVFHSRAGSEFDATGRFLPGTPTLANPFNGPPLPVNPFGILILDNDLQSAMVQQFNFGIRRELARDLIMSVNGLHTFGTNFVLPRILGVVTNPLTGNEDAVVNIEPSGKNWYDGLLVSVEKRATGRFSFITSYTLAKAFNYANDELFLAFPFLPLDPNQLRLEKGPTPNDQRHRFTFAGTFDAPWSIQLSPVLTVGSSVPFDILLPDGAARIPLIQRNAGARQFRNSAALNAFIQQINAQGGIAGIGPLPLVRDGIKFGDNFSSLDLRLSKRIKLGERASLQVIAEAFNLFNVTNIRGFQNSSYSGRQNVLARDSQDPNEAGFLRSSAFYTPLQTAGGVFGTGGPRAFQFAARINF